MLTDKTKNIAKEIREELKKAGLSNRQVGVNCKLTTENGIKFETIYIMVLVINTDLDNYVEKLYNKYKEKYESKRMNFIFMRASAVPENFAKMWMK